MAAALPKPSIQGTIDENQEFVRNVNRNIKDKLESHFENNLTTELLTSISKYYFDGQVSFYLEFTYIL